MEDIIKVSYEKDQPTVSARELHKALGIEKRFSAWFETNSQGFLENEDFSRVYLKVQANRYGGEQDLQDYELSVAEISIGNFSESIKVSIMYRCFSFFPLTFCLYFGIIQSLQ